jgi:ribulose-5-phosphate 4-epimerase/fuculose-1-phosphate aldolase
MRSASRRAKEEAVALFQAVGRASLAYDIQNSHSGNMAVKIKEVDGREIMAVTATGSQKADLEPDQICFFSFSETEYSAHGASTESIIHARVLRLAGVNASLHAHTKDLMIATLDDETKPNRPGAFVPLDPLGFFYLKGRIPVDWVRIPSGSPDMAELIYTRLSVYPAVVIQAHGVFARGRTLPEAFFHACLANNSGYIVRLLERLKVDHARLRAEVASRPEACFDLSLSDYELGTESLPKPSWRKAGEDFAKTGARIFESRLSPFHTGSMSKRERKEMLFATQASRPRDLGGPLRNLSLERQPDDTPEAEHHKAIYAASDFQVLLHCYLPEAEALALGVDPSTGRPAERITAIDAEGSFLYPAVPVVPPRPETADLVRFLRDYKMVVVRGGGVWAAGHRSLSEVLHHPSSLREICLYRLGAFERGLDLGKLVESR